MTACREPSFADARGLIRRPSAECFQRACHARSAGGARSKSLFQSGFHMIGAKPIANSPSGMTRTTQPVGLAVARKGERSEGSQRGHADGHAPDCCGPASESVGFHAAPVEGRTGGDRSPGIAGDWADPGKLIHVNPGVQEAREIAERHGLTLELLQRRMKTAATVAARGAIINALLSRGWSTVRIGRLLHRDHTTISYIGRWYDKDGRKRTAPIKTCIPARMHEQGCIVPGCTNVVRHTTVDEEALCPAHLNEMPPTIREKWIATRRRLRSAWAVVDALQAEERELWREATKHLRDRT